VFVPTLMSGQPLTLGPRPDSAFANFAFLEKNTHVSDCRDANTSVMGNSIFYIIGVVVVVVVVLKVLGLF